jgi:hypothetical protein
MLASALVDSAAIQLKEEAIRASSRDGVVGVRGIACAFEDLGVIFSREFDGIVACIIEILQRLICGNKMLCHRISEKRGQFQRGISNVWMSDDCGEVERPHALLISQYLLRRRLIAILNDVEFRGERGA